MFGFGGNIFKAVENNDLEKVAKVLTKHPDKVNAVDDSDNTPLAIAAENGNLQMVDLLLDNGADPNKEGLFGTPLALALNFGSEEPQIPERLIEKGADINAKFGLSGGSALHMTADIIGAEDAVEFLLEHGVDVNARDNYGSTPLHIVANGSSPKSAIAKLLIDAGADVNAKDEHGKTPLYYALRDENDERCVTIARVLREAGGHD